MLKSESSHIFSSTKHRKMDLYHQLIPFNSLSKYINSPQLGNFLAFSLIFPQFLTNETDNFVLIANQTSRHNIRIHNPTKKFKPKTLLKQAKPVGSVLVQDRVDPKTSSARKERARRSRRRWYQRWHPWRKRLPRGTGRGGQQPP